MRRRILWLAYCFNPWVSAFAARSMVLSVGRLATPPEVREAVVVPL